MAQNITIEILCHIIMISVNHIMISSHGAEDVAGRHRIRLFQHGPATPNLINIG